MKKIIILDAHVTNPGDLSWAPIEKIGDVIIYERTHAYDIITRCENAEIVVTNKCIFSKEIIESLPNLKCICLLATGYNNIDIKAADENNVTVCNAVGYSTDSVAQHVFSLILSVSNKIAAHNKTVHDGAWADSVDWSYRLSKLEEISNKTLGIYGFGTIGQKVAELGLAFGMKVIATKRKMEGFSYPNVELVSEEDLLSSSDYLSLNAALTDENKYFINKNTLKLMKSDAVLINTARGPLINENDLADALKNNQIRAACLDVLCNEPPEKDNPLFGLSNCIITPHVSWATVESRTRLIDIVAHNIASFNIDQPINVVKS
jgi:glycerate dehydrogenase